MKERAPHTVAVEAETVPVTGGLRHQSGNVEAISFHFVNLIMSDKKDFGVAFQERKRSGTRTSVRPHGENGMGYLAWYRMQTGNFTDTVRTGQNNLNTRDPIA
jgi:hypothetical protein